MQSVKNIVSSFFNSKVELVFLINIGAHSKLQNKHNLLLIGCNQMFSILQQQQIYVYTITTENFHASEITDAIRLLNVSMDAKYFMMYVSSYLNCDDGRCLEDII